MLRRRLGLVLLASWPWVRSHSARQALAEPYDLVIRGGKIVDGTGNPWFHGDVAIRGDRIVAVGLLGEKRPRDGSSTPAGWSSRPASSTCTRTPTDSARRRQRPEQDPPGRDDRGPRRGQLGRAVQGEAPPATVKHGGGKADLDDAGRLLRRAREPRASPSMSPPTSAWTTCWNA